MEKGDRLRQLLVADLALLRGLVTAQDVGAALMRGWESGGEDALLRELHRIADLSPGSLAQVEGDANRLIKAARGDAQLALTRHGLDRSVHAALDRRGADVGQALTELGTRARAPLREVDEARYTNFMEVGEGGMGVVYMALDTELDRWVAFKLVRAGSDGAPSLEGGVSPTTASPPPAGTPEARRFDELEVRFLQEAWITGGLEHPGIVPLYELGKTSGGVPFYTMRLVRGARTFADAIDDVTEAPIESRLALLEPFLKLLDTVRYAHDKGVVHRDLKPANVALGEYGEAVLLDWGLAKLEGDEDPTGSIWMDKVHAYRKATDANTLTGAMGTPGYMSPEAALGNLDAVDRRSDIYSLGAILFEILTGRLPFEFQGYAQLVSKLVAEDAPEASALNPGVPQPLSDLCARALSRDPEARPQTAEAFGDAMRHWQTESAVDREVDGLIHDAQRALTAAGEEQGRARLSHVDRAAAALAQVESRRPGHRHGQRLRKRAASLREEGMQERERDSGRRLLRRVAAAALLLVSVAAVAVGLLMDAKRREAETLEAKTAVALSQVLRLSDVKKVHDLLEEVDRLWPIHPDTAPRMAAWLEGVEAVLAHRGEHEAAHARLVKHGRQGPDANAGADGATATWTFESTDDAWRNETLLDLLAGLNEFHDPEHDADGHVAEIRRRLRASTTLRARSTEAHADAWQQTIAAIAASSKYGGLDLTPQVGLIPLGPDPSSGLFEFAHVGSGSLPTRDPKTNQLTQADDAAIVLVLIPGGTDTLGTQRIDKAKPNYAAGAEAIESNVHDVRLSPFFFGKYEVTQAQWAALTDGLRPSYYAAGGTYQGQSRTGRNPVEMISWIDCDRWLPRTGLNMPSEAQWEYACRAGSDTPWFTGRDTVALRAAANLLERDPADGSETMITPAEGRDGILLHGPVGSLAPNPFGLFDVHGNVWEWCRDTYRSRMRTRDDPDPVELGPGLRVARGGSYQALPVYAASAYRARSDGSIRDLYSGVRAARTITLK